jgi:adenylate kinase
MRLLFVGAPGVGKGTQAKRLAEDRKIPHIATGDILREAIRQGTPVGLKAKASVESGGLVPDDVMIGIIEERFGRGDTGAGYLLDGFPRTVPQAEALDRLLSRLGQGLQAVVLLECADGAILERITGRRTCETCQTPYHVAFQKPKREGVCDKDGGRLIQREDDTEAKVRRRLDKYHSETEAIIPFYERRGLVRRVDASRAPDEVYGAVQAALRGIA